MIKKMCAITLMLSALGMAVVPTAAMAEEEAAPSADFTLGVYNQYVWRGEAWSKDSVVLQPSLSVGYKGFGFNLWGNLDPKQYAPGTDENSNLSETDLTLSYDGSFGAFGYGIGYIYYELQGTPDPQEVYLSLSYDTLLSPSLTLYQEITGTQGWFYANFGISHSVPLTEAIALDLGANVGYFDNDGTVSGLHDGLVSASISIPVNKYITVTPEVHYSFALSNDSEAYLKTVSAFADNDENHLYGGIALSLAF